MLNVGETFLKRISLRDNRRKAVPARAQLEAVDWVCQATAVQVQGGWPPEREILSLGDP